jgi:gamma-glutamyl phosphate reductase
LESV